MTTSYASGIVLMRTETSSELQIWLRAATVIATTRNAATALAARVSSLADR